VVKRKVHILITGEALLDRASDDSETLEDEADNDKEDAREVWDELIFELVDSEKLCMFSSSHEAALFSLVPVPLVVL